MEWSRLADTVKKASEVVPLGETNQPFCRLLGRVDGFSQV